MRRLWEDPVYARRINGWLTVAWATAAIPICLFLAQSVPFLVFVSVYAVVTGHLSTWQSSRVEVNQLAIDEELDQEAPARIEAKVDLIVDDKADR